MKCKRKAEAKQKYDCEKFEIALLLGVPHPSKELLDQLRPVWKHCGPTLLANWTEAKTHAGSRPWAWWQFDAPQKRDYEKQPNEWDALDDWGLLQDWEYEAVNAQWRGWFGRDYYLTEIQRVDSKKK